MAGGAFGAEEDEVKQEMARNTSKKYLSINNDYSLHGIQH